jgi:hypothetical protein
VQLGIKQLPKALLARVVAVVHVAEDLRYFGDLV